MSYSNRRSFVMTLVAGGSVLAASRASAEAAAAPALSEADPQAVALGYKADASKVDAAKYPQHAATQLCSNCNLYQGKAADAMAPCTLFAGKQVAGKGWCSAWMKKAG